MTDKKKKILDKEITLPDGIKAQITPTEVIITGPKGIVAKKIMTKKLLIVLKDNKIKISSKVKQSKNEKALVNTLVAHIKNSIKGVQEPFVYKLKICTSHFPMTVKMKGTVLEVNNYIGEKIPRRLQIKQGVDVKVEGEIIVVTSPNIELAGHAASDIEKLTKRPGFDRRVFMDGIYITEKAGEQLK